MAHPNTTLVRRPIQDHAQFLVIDHLTRGEITKIFARIRVDPVTGCWVWRTAKPKQYPRIWFRGRHESVHRIMYAWVVEPLRRGCAKDIPQLDHVICDNPPCANPTHVILTTGRDNTLRSVTSPTAINARKTHCDNGHPFPSTPNRWDGGRRCDDCNRDYQRKWAMSQKIRDRRKTQEWKDHRNAVRRALAARKHGSLATSHQTDSV